MRFWQRNRLPALLAFPDAIASQVNSYVDACVAVGGSLTPTERQLLTAASNALRRRVQSDLWHDDQPAYFRKLDLLQVARFAQTASDAA